MALTNDAVSNPLIRAKEIPLHVSKLVLSAMLLHISAAAGQDADPAAPPQDWIEVPPGDGTFREYSGEFRKDTIDIPLRPYGELEYKLGMREGDTIVYEWEVVDIDDPELLYSEFHGHTERVGDEPGTLMFYRKASGGTERGALVAPFSGIHGWYLVNGSNEPIVVRLDVAGFYTLIDQ